MRHCFLSAAACLLVLGFVGQSSPCTAADKPDTKPAAKKNPTARPQPIDDQLLRELGEEPPPASKGMDKKPEKPANPLDDELLKQLEGDQPAGARKKDGPQPEVAPADDADNGPVSQITRRMRDVERRLGQRNGDDDTQQLERKIVAELDKLIKECSRQPQSSSGSSKLQPQQLASRGKAQQPQPGQQMAGAGKRSDKPARDSSQRLGKPKTEKPDMAKLKDLMKDVWGELPARLRQQMMQSSVEQFVPKYEFEIEEYFKTLSEQRQEQR